MEIVNANLMDVFQTLIGQHMKKKNTPTDSDFAVLT